jgi:hypothetical protein
LPCGPDNPCTPCGSPDNPCKSYTEDNNIGDNPQSQFVQNDPSIKWFPFKWAGDTKSSPLRDANGSTYDVFEGVYFRDCKQKCVDTPECEGIVVDYPIGFGPGGCYLQKQMSGGNPAQGAGDLFYKLQRNVQSGPEPTGPLSSGP